MGIVKYSPGIEYVKGSLAKPKKQDGHNHGDYLIGTHREAPTTSTECTRMYIRKGNTYDYPMAQTELAINARNRFTAISQAIKARKRDLSRLTDDQVAFLAQRDLPNGKKTMLAWYWMVEGDAYDQQHPRS